MSMRAGTVQDICCAMGHAGPAPYKLGPAGTPILHP